ncbi:MAG: hypothetical protein NTY19_01055 [Planctomycetota bacterium]|nr:hypothetical protein [Planctomycetota bacterium]
MSAAVIIAKQNRLMRNFTAADATNPATAKSPEDIGCRQNWIFRRMVARGVFVPVGNGRFYMDVQAADEFKRRRRGRLLWMLVLVAVAFLLTLDRVGR